MKYSSLISGFAGSIALTILHETLRKNVALAPRMDLMGEEGLAKVLSAVGLPVPEEPKLFNLTMGGDIAGNAVYYALVAAAPRHPVMAGAVLGAAAGVGALVLPDKLGLNKEHSNATPTTQLLTISIYLVGGIVAGMMYKGLNRKKRRGIK